MNRLDPIKRAQALSALVEGNSIRSVSRMTGIARNTIGTLLLEAGAACARYQDQTLRNLKCQRIQCDEIWSFCYAKDKNVPAGMQGQFGVGSVWTWMAIDADSKLIVTWMVGGRDGEAANMFIQDLAGRLANRVQLTSDGHPSYFDAVERAFGSDVDYAMLIKQYSGDQPHDETRYSPAKCIGCRAVDITGKPDRKHVSTSYVERQNLTMRMGMRRFTRLTNGFSKKLENHIAAVSLHFMHYNFVRIHQTTKVTPAMAANVTDKLWEWADVVAMIDQDAKAGTVEAEERRTWSLEPKGPALGHGL